tara:strand:+ start:1083 stop:2060 length:978 start_codon:yes stop_codon:yes gene_type:complete
VNLNFDDNIFVTGHNGMVGSAVVSALKKEGYPNIVIEEKKNLDLLDQSKVNLFFKSKSIDAVFICSAKVGGIHSNSEYPYDFIYQNLTIQNNIINSAHLNDVNKLLFLGSSCIYPKKAKQPIKESELLKGPLEPTNQWYALAKIAGIKTCEALNIQNNRDYRSLMPTNLYGPNDNFHDMNSHVIPALIRRFYESKINKEDSIIIWGSGRPLREFLHVDDLAKASIHVMKMNKQEYSSYIKPDLSHINIGTGQDVSIKKLSEILKSISGFEGKIIFDEAKPDGTMRKVLDISKIKSMGWKPDIDLKKGLKSTYQWYEKNKNSAKKA